MYLVSACLLGEKCKYNAGDNRNQRVIDFLKDKQYLALCPECLGGLPIPRPPAEIVDGTGQDVLEGIAAVMNEKGENVTRKFLKGAKKCLELAIKNQVTKAILKERSPSCGVKYIYDGSFSGQIITGQGVTAYLLEDDGIQLFSEDDI